MNYSKLITTVATRLNLPPFEVKQQLRVTLDVITDALHDGDFVRLEGIGIFRVKMRKGRLLHNPREHGIFVNIPSMKVVTFKASPSLKKLIRKP